MKTKIQLRLLLFAFFIPISLSAQIKLNISDCNTIHAQLEKDLQKGNYYTYWIEKEIVKNVWSEKEKKYGINPHVDFRHLENGFYRVTYLLQRTPKGKPSSIGASEKIVSEPIEIINCSSGPQAELGSSLKDFSVYPNPAQDIVYIDIDEIILEREISIVLFDFTGKKVMEEQIEENKHSLDVSTYHTGVYYLQILADDTPVYKEKLILFTK